jgi:integrase
MHDGKQRSVTAKTQAECLKRLKEAKKQAVGFKSNRSITLKDWLYKWYDLYKRPFVKPRTAQEAMRYIDKRILPYFKTAKLADITTEQIQAFVNQIPNATNNSKKKIFQLLQGAYRKAFDTQVIKYNPTNAVVVKFEKYQKKRAYEFTEQSQIIAELPNKYKAAFFFLCCTGLRIGEFLALTKEDVDFDRMAIRVNKAIDRDGVTGKTKTDSSNRLIPFIPILLETTYALHGSEDFFGTFTYYGLKETLKRLIKKLNITGVSVIHSTRHTFSSVCYFAGIPDLWIKNAMGHSTIAMTIDTYTNLLNKGTSPVLDYIKALKDSI